MRDLCGQPPPWMAAAVGDNRAQQSCSLQANSVSIRKGFLKVDQSKADLQAGEEEKEDLQGGCSSGVRSVCGVDQNRSVCGMSTVRLWPPSYTCNFPNSMGINLEPFWLTLKDLLMLLQEPGKGRAAQVTFPPQVRVKIRDRVWLELCLDLESSQLGL